MVHTDHGYEPAKGLAERLKEYKVFYDKNESMRLKVGKDILVTPPTAFKHRI